VLAEQVDGLDLQPHQHRVHDVTDVIRTLFRPPRRVAVCSSISQPNFVAIDTWSRTGAGVADERLVGEWAVDLRGVEMGYAALDRGADYADPFLPIGCRTVDGLEPHAPVSDGRHLDTGFAQCALLHDFVMPGRFNYF
jgi:hypothetical protein